MPRGGWGDTRALPTFTDHRLAGAVPSYTPAASPWGNRSTPHGLDAENHNPDIEMDANFNGAPSAAAAHIHQL
jgi:hypothetical protein